jgi:putative addiction module killer protein
MVVRVQETDVFKKWFTSLKDNVASGRITLRLLRLRQGHRGDARSVGEGVFELRIFHGPGYRVYFVERGRTRVILLCGGDKSTQVKDIRAAKELASQVQWKEEQDEPDTD